MWYNYILWSQTAQSLTLKVRAFKSQVDIAQLCKFKNRSRCDSIHQALHAQHIQISLPCCKSCCCMSLICNCTHISLMAQYCKFKTMFPDLASFMPTCLMYISWSLCYAIVHLDADDTTLQRYVAQAVACHQIAQKLAHCSVNCVIFNHHARLQLCRVF